MAINYTEKGLWLHEAIEEAGYSLMQVDGVWQSSDDVAVQAIIDSFDPLPYAQTEKRDEIKAEAAMRASVIYSFLETDPKQAVDFYNFAEDLYLSITPGSREPLSGRLLAFKEIRDAAVAAIATVNAETDWQAVMAYDVVTTPAWPT